MVRFNVRRLCAPSWEATLPRSMRRAPNGFVDRRLHRAFSTRYARERACSLGQRCDGIEESGLPEFSLVVSSTQTPYGPFGTQRRGFQLGNHSIPSTAQRRLPWRTILAPIEPALTSTSAVALVSGGENGLLSSLPPHPTFAWARTRRRPPTSVRHRRQPRRSLLGGLLESGFGPLSNGLVASHDRPNGP